MSSCDICGEPICDGLDIGFYDKLNDKLICAGCYDEDDDEF